MKTYCGYTAEEINEMEEEGSCPSHVLIRYMNDDYDGADELLIPPNDKEVIPFRSSSKPTHHRNKHRSIHPPGWGKALV